MRFVARVQDRRSCDVGGEPGLARTCVGAGDIPRAVESQSRHRFGVPPSSVSDINPP
jgi:hypothetical protein